MPTWKVPLVIKYRLLFSRLKKSSVQSRNSTDHKNHSDSSGHNAVSDEQLKRWRQPGGDMDAEQPVLMVRNSLTQGKVPFIPIDPAQNRVTWYICGPTVYDSAHLGHARTYITFDIIRRILQDYFGYEVFYAMNITDIDDKIILRARRNYLLAKYEKEAVNVKSVQDDVTRAFTDSISKMEAILKELTDKASLLKPKHLADHENRIAETKLKLKNLRDAEVEAKRVLEEEVKGGTSEPEMIKKYIRAAQDTLAQLLDTRLGASVTDQQIFRDHAAYFENEFMEDMQALGVREPSVLMRVTEYVPKIIKFIQKIVDNGYAYASNGSVYFSTSKYDQTHFYAKLCPQHRGNLELAEEGEGALGSTESDKRDQNDFALWKKSKPGEPFWESPWGPGRPGWHIECSVMASDYLGSNFDIHSGGVDLKFPHHDNELAQSEAYFECQQWVNYFFHTGHLHIDGLKISKSLKNFTTIRQQLKSFTGRQIRLMFLLQPWDQGMQYSDQTLAETKTRENQIHQFYLNIKSDIRVQGAIGKADQTWNDSDRKLHAFLTRTQGDVHAALLDNFAYHTAMNHVFDLIQETNKYRSATDAPKVLLLKEVASFITRILSVFGVIPTNEFGFTAGGSTGEEKLGKESILAPHLDAISTFRDQVRGAAFAKSDHRTVLELCDGIRDSVMPELGVRLEDVPGKPSVWKLDDPEVLIRQRDEKKKLMLEQTLAKARNKLKISQANVAKANESSVAPQARFASEVDEKTGKSKYNKFGADGLPTHDAEGKEIAKSQLKKLAKQAEKWQEQHQAHLDKLREDPGYLEKMKSEVTEWSVTITQLENQLAK